MLCTNLSLYFLLDIDAEDILNTVKNNINNNRHFIKSDIQIEKIDFLQRNFSDHLEQLFDIVDIILAADGKLFIF